jgi:hypothetical protein
LVDERPETSFGTIVVDERLIACRGTFVVDERMAACRRTVVVGVRVATCRGTVVVGDRLATSCGTVDVDCGLESFFAVEIFCDFSFFEVVKATVETVVAVNQKEINNIYYLCKLNVKNKKTRK